MASLRKRGDRFYLLFFDASRTPKQKTGYVSKKTFLAYLAAFWAFFTAEY